MRVTDGRVDVLCQLVACPDIEIVSDKITAASRSIAVGKTASISPAASEEVIEAISIASQPVPAVAPIDTQILDRLELELYFRRFDILENDVIIRRPGPRETEEPLKAV